MSINTSNTYKHIEVLPREAGFGASIQGLDLSRPLSPETLAEVLQAWTDHAVVAFPDQPLSHEQLEQFTAQIVQAIHAPDVQTQQEVIRLLIERIIME